MCHHFSVARPHMRAKLQSFGIVMWEVLTRALPYSHLAMSWGKQSFYCTSFVCTVAHYI